MNKIFNKSSEFMSELDDNSVDLIITSPPYNVGMEYEAERGEVSLQDYLFFLKTVFSECKRVMKDGARICINVANTGRKPYISLSSYVSLMMTEELDFWMKDDIIWLKGASARKSTAWGSWLSASNPYLRDVHEYILVFSKGGIVL